RSHVYNALAVYKNLREHGYEVFFDYESIDSGAFDQAILNQIAARTHFILILTAGALDRCSDPHDWLRQEIEQAIDLKRNIIPLIFEGFDLAHQQEYLTGKMAILRRYNGLDIPKSVIYFDTAMEHLRERFLNKPLEGVLHPTPTTEEAIIRRRIATTDLLIEPSRQQINLEDYLSQGLKCFKEGNFDAAIERFTEAVWVNPRLAKMYVYRATCRIMKGDYSEAIFDADEALRLEPQNARAYSERGVAHYWMRNFDQAISDLNRAIELDPKLRKPLSSQLAEIYLVRGSLLRSQSRYLEAIRDFSHAINFRSSFVDAYYHRALTYNKVGEVDKAINDLTSVLMVNSKHADAYYNRGMAYQKKGEFRHANNDYEQYIQLRGENADTVRQWIIENEKYLKKR
ncbi:MAG TPA: tetratricopeptide repeat protein, partial [Phototrophicaceae bacterium]|nr:tetratricopeptide repeat protein [Phototrophicaceae bacterium]